MSVLDKIVAAVTPPESDETRLSARAVARAETSAGDWLNAILDHHDRIEAAFGAVRSSAEPSQRLAAFRELALLLTGHSNAEEAVVYPAVADSGHKAHSALAYEEQAAAKVQMALLEKIDPVSQDFLDKLEHIRGAVTHHMYQEESSWLLGLKRQLPGPEQARLSERYREEAERYLGASA